MTIDLSRLARPDLIEALAYEPIYQNLKERFLAFWEAAREADPTLPAIDVLDLDTDPAAILLQTAAFMELVLRARINSAARSNLLAFATGSDLDHKAADAEVVRLVVTPATDNTAAVMEGDERLRARTQMAIRAFSVAGPADAYRYHAMTAAPSLQDVSVANPRDNRIEISLLSALGSGAASSAEINAVAAALSPKTVRPLTDDVRIRSANIVPAQIEVRLVVAGGPAPAAIKAAAESAIAGYVSGRRRIGRALRLDGIIAAARSAGDIEQAIVISPTADIDPGHEGAVHVTSITVVMEVLS